MQSSRMLSPNLRYKNHNVINFKGVETLKARWLMKMISLVIGLFFSFSVQSADLYGLRYQRYCEILLGTPLRLQVYNTIGLNSCPADQWNKVTIEKIKKETGALFVHLNGPRYWVIDGLQNSELINPKIKILGGIAMREAGVLKLRLLDLWLGQKPYQRHEVHRKTTWVYQAGKPIYEIIDSEGNVYVMQSYSTQKVQQTTESLSNLGSKLHLPEGWSFRIRTLQQEAHLTAINQQAVVIQDEFWNTYQQAIPPF